ncbi:SpoIIE family protein phosphatase [Streptomyces fumanus]|uniref:SpoIIE family protein phosphatase n=1 Tax=Streptomyces fumanus TaxID=67302 RepID=UPI003F4CCD09
MTSEHATPPGTGAAPDLETLSKAVANQRAEMDRLLDRAATSAVLERAKGAVMALTGCSADEAREALVQRAKSRGHSLLEECWITLGGLGPPLPAADDPGLAEAAAAPAGTVPPAAPASDDVSAALTRLAKVLVRVGSPQDLARCLLEHLAPDVGADAVLLYSKLSSGALELAGHAGIDAILAAQWRQVPPLAGMAAPDTLRSGEPRWLEDFERDSQRYLLIGDPPGRWRSRAWLPVPEGAGGGTAEFCLGVLRRRAGPFSPAARDHLRAVARLCAGLLRTYGVRREAATAADAGTVQRVLDTLPVAAMLLTPLRGASGEVRDLRIDAATGQAAGLAARGGETLAGRRFLECFPALAGEPLWPACLNALATGEPYEGEPFAHQGVVAGAAELSMYSVRVVPLGGGLMLTWVRHDSSDRQEQRLADLQRLGNLGWANWNLVTHEAGWSTQVFAIFGRDPVRGPVRLGDLPALAQPEDRPEVDRAVEGLLRHGRPCDVPFRSRTPLGVRHVRFVAEAATDAGGTPVEVHGFVQDLTARRRVELALVESERAMLTQHDVLRAERTLAARLQHALLPLPEEPVRLSGLRVEVAYLPAQAGVHVGGDWFSAIELPDGDALLVVGDVAGHSVDAVATMAQLRFAAKGMVITGSSLTGALTRLNTLLLHSRDSHGTASMVLGRYERRRHRLVWAQAGHPPPLLVRDGTARYLDRPRGMLLGASTAPAYEEDECVLRPGDRLILYTDGLVERPPENIDLGLERLARAAAAAPRADTGSLGRLLTALLEGRERRDDVCVLDIRVPHPDDADTDG